MASSNPLNRNCWRRSPALRMALLATFLPLAACSQINPLVRGRPVAVVAVSTPTNQPREATRRDSRPGSHGQSLSEIINDDLQHGHFEDGRRALLRYLRGHPDDRLARSMLHQLTADPERVLGSHWTAHKVEPGDSYSVLADRYLGDATLFVILARYNGSSNPSVLHVGQTLHMPTSARGAAAALDHADATQDKLATRTPSSANPGAAATSPAGKAMRMQAESVALLDKGHKRQALARLDKALTLDPGLKASGPKARELRQQLISSYHERAIVLYRDQKLDQAITLWNRVLAIDPNYEPAVVYRARARELKRRLKQL